MERQFVALLAGDFLQRTENVLVFGNPGSGKTHLLCALGHELVKQGHSVYFAQCVLLVQRLLLAKAELWLEKELKRLDRYEALIIDDLGYVQQSRDEMEVLFIHPAGASLRTSQRAADQQSRLFRMGADLQRSHDHGGGCRSTGASQRHPGDESTELSHGER